MQNSLNKVNIRSWVLLALASLIYFFANLQKVIVPGAAFDELQYAFSLDAAGVTRLGAVFLYVYAGAQLITGVLADRFGGIRVIIAGGAVFCVGSLLSAVDNSLSLLYFSRFLTGLGAAAIYLSVLKEISRVAAGAVPLMLGIVTIIGYSGAITGASPFIAGIDRFGYSAMLLAAGSIMTLIYLFYIIIAAKEKFPPVCREVKFSISSYWAVLKSRQNCFLILSIGISFGTYFAMQSIIGKKFLEDFCEMNEKHSGAVLTATMIIAAVNGFILANLSKWRGNIRRPFIMFSGFGCLAGALLLFIPVFFRINGCMLPVAGMLLLSFAGNISPIYVALLKESNAENRFGTVACVGNCFAYGVSAVFGGLTGVLMEVFPPQICDSVKIYGRESYLLVFAFLMILGAVSATLTIFVKESFGKNIAPKQL